jgi:hypothetical protein
MKIKNLTTLSDYDKDKGFKKAVIVIETDKSVKLVNESEVKSNHQ